MSRRPDIVIHDPNGRLLAVIEVKGIAGTDNAWAADYLRNIAESDGLPPETMFAVFTPDRVFVWRRRDDAYEPGDAPTYSGDVSSSVDGYAKRLGIARDSLRGYTFESLVALMLSDAAFQSGEPSADYKWLLESGFADILCEGTVSLESTVRL